MVAVAAAQQPPNPFSPAAFFKSIDVRALRCAQHARSRAGSWGRAAAQHRARAPQTPCPTVARVLTPLRRACAPAAQDFSSPVRDFFSKNVLGVALVPIPTFLDEREMLRARLHELEERLRNVEAAASGEIRELKAALAKAESALEASKLERARSAVETMKHWRQHRKEVEKLRDDQSALMASVGDLRAVRAEADKLRAERDAAVARVAALEAQLAKGKR